MLKQTDSQNRTVLRFTEDEYRDYCAIQAENAQLKKALEFLAPKIDCTLCPHKIGGCYRIESECGRDVMAWAMEQAKC